MDTGIRGCISLTSAALLHCTGYRPRGGSRCGIDGCCLLLSLLLALVLHRCKPPLHPCLYEAIRLRRATKLSHAFSGVRGGSASISIANRQENCTNFSPYNTEIQVHTRGTDKRKMQSDRNRKPLAVIRKPRTRRKRSALVNTQVKTAKVRGPTTYMYEQKIIESLPKSKLTNNPK